MRAWNWVSKMAAWGIFQAGHDDLMVGGQMEGPQGKEVLDR